MLLCGCPTFECIVSRAEMIQLAKFEEPGGAFPSAFAIGYPEVVTQIDLISLGNAV